MLAVLKVASVEQAIQLRAVVYRWLQHQHAEMNDGMKTLLAASGPAADAARDSAGVFPTHQECMPFSGNRLAVSATLPTELLRDTFNALPLIEAKAVFQMGLKEDDYAITDECAAGGTPGATFKSALALLKKRSLPVNARVPLQQHMKQYMVCPLHTTVCKQCMRSVQGC